MNRTGYPWEFIKFCVQTRDRNGRKVGKGRVRLGASGR